MLHNKWKVLDVSETMKKTLAGVCLVAICLLTGYCVGSFRVSTETAQQASVEPTAVKTEETPKIKYNRTIAIVNLDEGIKQGDTVLNYGNSLINTIDTDVRVTGLQDARNGIENGEYSAYLVIPSTFSTNVMTINEKPVTTEITYAVASGLEGEDRDNAIYSVYAIYNSFSSNVSQIYTSTILDEYHDAQDAANTIMSNDTKDMNAFMEIQGNDLIETTTIPELEDVEFNVTELKLDEDYKKNEEYVENIDITYQESLNNANTELDNIRLEVDTVSSESKTAWAQVSALNDILVDYIQNKQLKKEDLVAGDEAESKKYAEWLTDVSLKIDTYNALLEEYNNAVTSKVVDYEYIELSYRNIIDIFEPLEPAEKETVVEIEGKSIEATEYSYEFYEKKDFEAYKEQAETQKEKELESIYQKLVEELTEIEKKVTESGGESILGEYASVEEYAKAIMNGSSSTEPENPTPPEEEPEESEEEPESPTPEPSEEEPESPTPEPSEEEPESPTPEPSEEEPESPTPEPSEEEPESSTPESSEEEMVEQAVSISSLPEKQQVTTSSEKELKESTPAPLEEELKESTPVLSEEEPESPEPSEEEPESPAPSEEEPESPTPSEEEPENPAPSEEEPESPAPSEEEPESPEPSEEEPESPAPSEEEPESPAPSEEEPSEPTPDPPKEEPEEPTPDIPEEETVTPGTSLEIGEGITPVTFKITVYKDEITEPSVMIDGVSCKEMQLLNKEEIEANLGEIIKFAEGISSAKTGALNDGIDNSTAMQQQYVKVEEAHTSLEASQTELGTQIKQFDLNSFIDNEQIGDSLSMLLSNTLDIAEKVNKHDLEYQSYTDDVYQTTEKNVNDLKENIIQSQELSEQKIMEGLEAAKNSRAASNETNVRLLKELTSRLPYTRLGNIENREVYTFMARPVTLYNISKSVAVQEKQQNVTEVKEEKVIENKGNQMNENTVWLLAGLVVILIVGGIVLAVKGTKKPTEDF